MADGFWMRLTNWRWSTDDDGDSADALTTETPDVDMWDYRGGIALTDDDRFLEALAGGANAATMTLSAEQAADQLGDVMEASYGGVRDALSGALDLAGRGVGTERSGSAPEALARRVAGRRHPGGSVHGEVLGGVIADGIDQDDNVTTAEQSRSPRVQVGRHGVISRESRGDRVGYG